MVLILDHLVSEHFHQLACTLRRRGVRTIKITSAPGEPIAPGGGSPLLRSWRDRLMYDARASAAQMGRCLQLQDAIAAGRVVDVLASESTLTAMLSSAPVISALARKGLAFARLPPRLLVDKFEVNALLQRSGVRIPPQLRACDVTPAEAARALGLPLLVKACVGLGGTGVRLARSVEQVEQAVAELADEDGGGVFYQKYVHGQMVMYCAVSAADGPLIEHGVIATHVQNELGPSARVRLFDDPALLAAGRLAVQALGCRGLAEIGFLRDPAGGLWHVDANCRSWGNMISQLCMGIDFTEAYRALMLGLPYAPRQRPEPGSPTREVAVLPFSLYQAASHGSLGEVRSLARSFAQMCWRGPGLRYAAPVAIKVGLLLTSRLARTGLRSIGRSVPLLW